jgi:hypothetical protein
MEDIEKEISFIVEKREELKEKSAVMRKSFQASTPENPMAKVTSDRDSGLGLRAYLQTSIKQWQIIQGRATM